MKKIAILFCIAVFSIFVFLPITYAQETFGEYTLIDYDEYFRYPDRYLDEKVFLRGEVVQIVSDVTGMDIIVEIDGEDWVYVYEINGLNFNLIEGDEVTVFGEFEGIYNYTTVLGVQNRIPGVKYEELMLGHHRERTIEAEATEVPLPSPTPQLPSATSITSTADEQSNDGIHIFRGIDNIEFSWTPHVETHYYILTIYDDAGKAVKTAYVNSDTKTLKISDMTFEPGRTYAFEVTSINSPDGLSEIVVGKDSVLFIVDYSLVSDLEIVLTGYQFVVDDVYVFRSTEGVTFSWSAKGDVFNYTIKISCDSYGVIYEGESDFGGPFNLTTLPIGENCVLEVVAHPAGEGEDIISSVLFRIEEFDSEEEIVW